MSEPRPRITHELKTWPEFFNATRCGRKQFELRRNNRGFQVGDKLLLKEWVPERDDPGTPLDKTPLYTGRELLVRVDYIMDESAWARLRDLDIEDIEYVIMSVSLVS